MARLIELVKVFRGSHTSDFSAAILYFSGGFEKKFVLKTGWQRSHFRKSWTKNLQSICKIVSFEGGGRTENQKPIGFTFREKIPKNRIFGAPANFEARHLRLGNRYRETKKNAVCTVSLAVDRRKNHRNRLRDGGEKHRKLAGSIPEFYVV